jgi:predicted dehydrogenase
MYKVAIIGAGVWSANHLAGWRARGDVEVVCVVRSRAAAAEATAARWRVPSWSDDWPSVVARADVDIVDICLPHDLHAEVACAALEEGKHVVLEKPLAATLKDALRIAETTRRTGRMVMISENWIYMTLVQKAKAAIEAGEIGQPFLLRSVMDMDVRPGFKGLNWRYDAARMGGGALLDGGIHAVSAARYLMGEVSAVAALQDTYHFKEFAPLEDTSLLLLRFASGASGTIAIAWTAQRERPRTEFTILGPKGTIEFDTHLRQYFSSNNQRRCEQHDLAASRGFVEQMAHFIGCLESGRDPITTPEEQIGSLKVVLAAYRSAASGRLVPTEEIAA